MDIKSKYALDRYVKWRLGPGDWPKMCGNMFSRSLTAPSLSAFWRYWNPGYGFVLLTYVYQPLRRWFAHSIAVFITFLFCGFAFHDVFYLFPLYFRDGKFAFPFVTVWFGIIALGIVATELAGINFCRLHKSARIPIHITYLATAFLIARYFS